MAGFGNLRELLREIKEALREIITEPVMLVMLLSGLFALILLHLLL
jgi:hypothetical protein